MAGLACALGLVVPAALVFDGGGANAVTTLQSCSLNKGTATISPGLTLTPVANATITAKGSLTGCTPATATGGSGTSTSVIHLKNASCQSLAAGGSTSTGTAKATWKNGKTSNGTITVATTTQAPTTATLTGKTTSGTLFNPSTTAGSVMFTAKFTGTGTACSATNPLKTLTFTSTYGGKTHPYTFKH
jgi:hypothetical protein